eukprot:CAMPEP_0181415842 /NCGR_PEP_ID=MMETSP1110-20121109/10220_1 /TAXON_ID=174948 /ORGANISM="Symbiodinium sp., Strain CCMP421" /LENGTH=91 /DNA_ID=CAMNT_0023538747 /DNA_START=383 /DNA_END=654 /DNA_ORIENTATION=-
MSGDTKLQKLRDDDIRQPSSSPSRKRMVIGEDVSRMTIVHVFESAEAQRVVLPWCVGRMFKRFRLESEEVQVDDLQLRCCASGGWSASPGL